MTKDFLSASWENIIKMASNNPYGAYNFLDAEAFIAQTLGAYGLGGALMPAEDEVMEPPNVDEDVDMPQFIDTQDVNMDIDTETTHNPALGRTLRAA